MSNPVAWPDRARVIVTLTVAWESWAEDARGGLIGEPPLVADEYRQRGIRDLARESWQDYAGRRAMDRVTDLLAANEVLATGVFNGLCVERWPEPAKRWIASGQEIAAHAYTQDIKSFALTPDQERAHVRRTMDAIEKVTGRRPVGWCSPGAQRSEASVDVWIAEGLRYSMDFHDDELPYIVEGKAGRIVAIPYQYDTNDLSLYAVGRNPPSVYFEFFKRKFDWLYREGAPGSPRLLSATIHLHLFGRPFAVGVFEECIRYAKGFPGVWFARRDEVARLVLEAAS